MESLHNQKPNDPMHDVSYDDPDPGTGGTGGLGGPQIGLLYTVFDLLGLGETLALQLV